jgi:high affinity Mn2+ porin
MVCATPRVHIARVSRASWSPGLIEIIGWTDCDQSLSLGTVLKGTSWGRPNDRIGVAGVIEGLSPEARAYFATGLWEEQLAPI